MKHYQYTKERITGMAKVATITDLKTIVSNLRKKMIIPVLYKGYAEDKLILDICSAELESRVSDLK